MKRIVKIKSELYGTEDFEYKTSREQLAAFRRLVRSAKRQTARDHETRIVELINEVSHQETIVTTTQAGRR